jgi:hypothetical protein
MSRSRRGGGVVDQHPQDAAADRDMADRGPLLPGHPGSDELGNGAVAAHDAQGAVTGAGEVGGQVDDALEHGRQRQLRGQGEPGL